MIFVCLGTNDKSFERLLKEIDKQIELGNINDRVVVQSGYTKYESNNMEIVDLMSIEEFNKNISDCDILITHGHSCPHHGAGLGTCFRQDSC